MTGLIIKLAPNERILINGAVVENGDRRAKIAIRTADTRILRLRDAIHPDTVDTPLKRLCYICQLLLVGDMEDATGKPQLLVGLEQISRIFLDPDSCRILGIATDAVIASDYYRALRELKSMLSREARYLGVRHGV